MTNTINQPKKNKVELAGRQKKRNALFYVFQILKDYTDYDHHLKHTEILEKVFELYGLKLERKSIREYIEVINELGEPYGIEVYSEKGHGAYMNVRPFERSEIAFLVDAIFSSKSIGQKQAKELASKLSNNLSVYDRKDYSYISKSDEINRTDVKYVFNIIDILSEAIAKGKKIAFNYHRLYLDARKNEYKKNRRLVASPYHLLNNQGKYYLICNNNIHDDLANYRVERIENVEILDEDVKPIKSLKGCEKGFDITKYANENVYMFSNGSVDARIRIDNEYSISYVQDWFGNNAKIKQEEDGKVYATIKANEQALIYWCLQYGETIELLEPTSTREKIKTIVIRMEKKYHG